eukprot:6203360-Pleurochrysis_carterae.AAC.2
MVDASTQSESLDALLDALIREREVARYFGQATTRVSGPTLGSNTTTPHTGQAGVECRLCPSLLARARLTLPRHANP